METPLQEPIKIFYSYALADEVYCQELDKHLSTLKRLGRITTWSRWEILGGTDQEKEINAHIKSAHIILLLVSPDFLASDSCYNVEMQQALARSQTGQARVIPVLVRPADWHNTPIDKLQSLPSNGLPIKNWPRQEDAFLNIVQGLQKVLEDLTVSPQEDTSVNSQHEQQSTSVQETVEIKPSGFDPKRPATVFLSYKRQNADEVAILERELKLRGVKPWRDVADLQKGRPVKEEITDAIAHQTDALLIYLTPESLTSSFIWEVEIPTALERYERDHSFSIIPVLRGVNSAEVQRLCASHDLRSLTEFNYDSLPDPQVDQATFNEKCREVASQVLNAALRLRLRRVQADDGYEPSIGLHTFKEPPSPPSLDLDLNWYDLFLDRNHLPSQAEWQGMLFPALLDVKNALGELRTSRRLHISLQSILPAAFALGSTFPTTTSFTLLPRNKEDTWSSTGPASPPDPLRRLSYNNEEGDSRVAIVEIAIAQLTASGVSKTLPLLDLSYRHHLRFSLPEGLDHGTGVKDASHARAMAHQIGKELRSLSGKGVSQIHLFTAIPAALAVLIGHQFNAICPVTIYEYSRLDGMYKLACTL